MRDTRTSDNERRAHVERFAREYGNNTSSNRKAYVRAYFRPNYTKEAKLMSKLNNWITRDNRADYQLAMDGGHSIVGLDFVQISQSVVETLPIDKYKRILKLIKDNETSIEQHEAILYELREQNLNLLNQKQEFIDNTSDYLWNMQV